MASNQIFHAGQMLPWWQRWIATIVRFFYFHSVKVLTPQGGQINACSSEDPPTIYYVSHRNGAVDGYIVQKLHPFAVSMVSVQLIVHPLLKWFFSGIPVLRPKDEERFGDYAKNLGNPMINTIRHIEAGGSIFIFPEGSSEWGFAHLPYQSGAARIIKKLLQKNILFRVRAVGLFYTDPDKFRSDVDIIVSPPLEIAPQMPEEGNKDFETRIFNTLNTELDHISVHCQNEAHFKAVCQRAKQLYQQQDGSYGVHFLNAQKSDNLLESDSVNSQVALPVPTASYETKTDFILNLKSIIQFPAVLIFIFLMFPVLLTAYLAGKKADAKNTVTFFRVIAGMYMGCIWGLVLIVLLFLHPVVMAFIFGIALYGLFAYRSVCEQLKID